MTTALLQTISSTTAVNCNDRNACCSSTSRSRSTLFTSVTSSSSSSAPSLSSIYFNASKSRIRHRNPNISEFKRRSHGLEVNCSAEVGGVESLKIMISGAPASGKGTQSQMILEKFGVVHISTGDLLRAEVSSGTEMGNKAKGYMDSGSLVPDEIVTAMVKTRLSQEDAKEKGWLLDGYPRSSTQAESLERINIRPDIYIVLDVPDEILIDRCIGRRLDPVTGRIYHLKNFPPETEEIRARLITRSDDTEEKAKSRLETYKKNVEAISSTYMDILKKVDGNRPKDVVFEEITSLLLEVRKVKEKVTELDQ